MGDVVLNEQDLSKEQFEEKQEKIEKQPDVKIVKIKEDTYRTKVYG